MVLLNMIAQADRMIPMTNPHIFRMAVSIRMMMRMNYMAYPNSKLAWE